jgi:hypothetical protein
MSVFTLPSIQDSPHYDFVVELDGATYLVELKWNEREAAWYLSIGADEDTPLVAGKKVVLNIPLISRHRDSRLPPGALIALDTSGKDEPPGLDDLGRRVVLTYSDEETVDEVLAEVDADAS